MEVDDMRDAASPLSESRTDRAAFRHMQAWLVLVATLAVHVVDEALTGFLGFYNPLVLAIRSRIYWFPMPTFTFRVWLAGLIAVVLVLALLGPAVRRGAAGTRPASWMLSGFMFLNGLGHLGGSLYFQRWLPGATSAPVLLVASVLLAHSTWQRQRSAHNPHRREPGGDLGHGL
jgi:hypothetical protein